MPIWKLTPTDLADPIWQKWSPEPFIVRAETEAAARHLAHVEAASAVRIPGPGIIINPWRGHKLLGDPAPLPTRCEDITEQAGKYSVDGPAEILHRGEEFKYETPCNV